MALSRDKPKHKPSTKHTLEEVLHSLQDLVHNELATDTPGKIRSGRLPTKSPDQVVQSLKSLIQDDDPSHSDSPATQTDTHAQTPEAWELEALEAELEQTLEDEQTLVRELTQSFDSAGTETLKHATSNGHTLPAPVGVAYDPGGAVVEDEAEINSLASETLPATIRSDSDTEPTRPSGKGKKQITAETTVNTHSTKQQNNQRQLLIPGTEDMHAPTAPSAEHITQSPVQASQTESDKDILLAEIGNDASEIELDNIPLLDKVAAPPPKEINSAPIAQPPPTPGQAHEIAIRTIAKLNIELRKCGERGLEPMTVNRLQHLLREELEHQATNMDNRPAKRRD